MLDKFVKGIRDDFVGTVTKLHIVVIGAMLAMYCLQASHVHTPLSQSALWPVLSPFPYFTLSGIMSILTGLLLFVLKRRKVKVRALFVLNMLLSNIAFWSFAYVECVWGFCYLRII